MTHEDYVKLFEVLDDRYVKQKECDDRQEHYNKRFANDDTRIKLFEQKMKQWEWMFRLIATGVIGTFITSFLALIFK